MTDTQVRNQIRERFAQIARSPETERVFPVGSASAKNLGYDADEIDALPAEVTESFSGVGNPLALGELVAGQTVLDLGCGAGLDSILAARRVGPTGKVVAVDMTEAMLHKARAKCSSRWHFQHRVAPRRCGKFTRGRWRRGRGDHQRRPQPVPRQTQGTGRATPCALPRWSSATGGHPAPRKRDGRKRGEAWHLVGLNPRCRKGAVAP